MASATAQQSQTRLTGATAPEAAKDPRVAQILGELEKVRKLHQAALSPDGKTVAWVVDGEHGGTQIMVAPAGEQAQASARRITVSEKNAVCLEEEVAWSPDNGSLAFLSNCETPKQSEIYVADAASKKTPRRLTHLHGYVHALQWSPDGGRISFLYVEGATRPAGALAAMKPPAGVIGEEGLEIQRVAAIEVGKDGAKGEARQLTPAALHVYEFDWSPDSAKLAYIAAAPPGENNWWVAQLYTQPVSNPADEGNARSLLDPARVHGPLRGMQIAVPRWSRDGQYIAFIGGLMSDQGATGGDLYLVPAAQQAPDAAPVPLSQQNPGSTMWFAWLHAQQSAPGSGLPGIVATEVLAGSTHLETYAASAPLDCLFPLRGAGNPGCGGGGGRLFQRTELTKEDATLGDGRLEGSLSLSADTHDFVTVQSSFFEPPEVVAANISGAPRDGVRMRPLSHYNEALKPAWGKSESVQWNNESFHVQGWLHYPVQYDPAKKYPLIVLVHGGPASAVLPHWPGLGLTAAPFSAMDYFVLEPNPRGSYGGGEEFTAANRKDFGYGDLRDIVAGVDAVTSRYSIDPDRVGLTGWSYGGFMTMFAVTQTQRFRAAVAGAGISNWQSYYGENSIDQWMVPYFGATVYDDPAVYAKSSAIEFIHRVNTPTLIVVGDRDGECPAPQSFEFWHALRALNVPAKLVVYPNEGHGFVDPAHRLDVLERALAWFGQYMQPRPASH